MENLAALLADLAMALASPDYSKLVRHRRCRPQGMKPLRPAVPAKEGVRESLQGGIARFEMRLTALLSMRKLPDGIEKFLILRKLRSSCLEGRKALIQPIVDFLTPSKAGTHFSAAPAAERWAPAFAGEAFNIIKRHKPLVASGSGLPRISPLFIFGTRSSRAAPLCGHIRG
jgi:hypothetical protein